MLGTIGRETLLLHARKTCGARVKIWKQVSSFQGNFTPVLSLQAAPAEYFKTGEHLTGKDYTYVGETRGVRVIIGKQVSLWRENTLTATPGCVHTVRGSPYMCYC